MSAVAAAIIGSVTAIGGGLIAAGGAKSAAKAQVQAAQDANAAQERMFEKQTALQEPFRQGGLTAQSRIFELLGLKDPNAQPSGGGANNPAAYGLTPVQIPNFGFGDYGGQSGGGAVYQDAQGNIVTDVAGYMAQHPLPASAGAPSADFGKYARDFGNQDFQQDPGYAFRQAEGQKALERSAAARGGLLSGGTLKGIQRFGQDLASQEYQNAFNRYQVNRSNQLNPLQSLMGSGQSATNTLTGAAGQQGQNQANNLMNAGAARASGYVGAANALGGALNSVGQAAASYPLMQAQINYLNRSPTGGTPPIYDNNMKYLNSNGGIPIGAGG